jgi:hypothetical protein
MANKNIRRKNVALAIARRAGHTQLVTRVPIADYHSSPLRGENLFRNRAFDILQGNVSRATRRNMQQIVFRNKNANGLSDSITRHEPISPNNYVTHKNHKYMEYRQPAGAR